MERGKVSVRSVPPVFRRAGLVFTHHAQTYTVNEDTYNILKAEPNLVVEVLPYEDRAIEIPASNDVAKQEKSGSGGAIETLLDVAMDIAEIVTDVAEEKEDKPAELKAAAKGKK